MSLSRRFGLFTPTVTVAFSIAVFAAPTFINILTGGTNGVYYPIGVGLSWIYRHDIQDAKTSVQATKASVENLNLLQAGHGELALVLGDSVVNAWNRVADAGFKTPLKKLRAIGNTYPNYIQVVANQASGIKTLADLKGERISMGASKSDAELNARAIFKTVGLSYGDIGKMEYLPYVESVELIKNRRLDTTLQSSSLGITTTRNLASTMSITFVTVPIDVVAKIGNPAYRAASISADTYDGQEQDMPTVVIGNILVNHPGVSDKLAYQMTKLMFDSLPRLVTAHAAAKDITLDKTTKNLPIPLHPGAGRFYKEKGILPE